MKRNILTKIKRKSSGNGNMRRMEFQIFLLAITLTLVSPPKTDAKLAPKGEQVNILVKNTTIEQIKDKKENSIPEIYPQPVLAEYTNIYHRLYTDKGTPEVYLVSSGEGELKAAKVFNHQLEIMNEIPLPVVSDLKKLPRTCSFAIHFSIEASPGNAGEQAYSLTPVDFNNKRIVEASGSEEEGCIYAATALAQLVTSRNGKTVLREAAVEDCPVYKRRIFMKRSEEKIQDMLDWMIKYRMECLRLPPNLSPWWKVSEELREALTEVNQWKKEYDGVHIMLALHIYRGRDIVVADPDDRDKLKKVIKAGIENGVDRVMISSDDSAPFKNGEGYILTSEKDKAQFANMAEAHCFLMKDLREWLNTQGAKCELYYCPPFYTYEDINLGEMGLYKGTPWEEGAFGPFKRYLQTIGKNMPEDVFVIWTGPNVRTRKITNDDLNDWKNNLAGRVPFLWDNSIYSHHPFTTTPLFTAYDNELPNDFQLKTTGNGIYIHGNIEHEIDRPAYMTANDFLWNPAAYVPEQSLQKSIAKFYGSRAVPKIIEFRDAELSIRRLKGEQQLKSDIDTLWNAIAKVRATTSKNPFYYMRIYIRLKGLRNQLRCSLPENQELDSYAEQVAELDRERRDCIESLEKEGLIDLVNMLKKEMVEVP